MAKPGDKPRGNKKPGGNTNYHASAGVKRDSLIADAIAASLMEKPQPFFGAYF
ncbi:hypothetical protein ACL2XP_17390 [Sodalis sp. RH21]|uniref:hypothetical protein n=1 Tax=unclassified Sodalis (in: enterobacteria) TaxID=2636512 RepID=UPI0039B42033